MAYTVTDFPTKTAMKKAAQDSSALIKVYQPNADITGHQFKDGEIVVIEGPHYPKPHRWYARVRIKQINGEFVIDKIIS